MVHLYESSSKIYTVLFKYNRAAWGITKEEFLQYPVGSLGYALGMFYKSKGFDIMPKLENHDAYHVITGIGTEVEEEVAMQFLLLGNGKVSLYLLGVIVIGTLFFPEYWNLYKQAYQKGRARLRFHDLDFQHFLETPLTDIQASLSKAKHIIILNKK